MLSLGVPSRWTESSGKLRGLIGLLAAVLAAAACTATASAQSGLPVVSSGQRPGPEILYAPPATAPQLTNAPGSGWKAPPILVSGAHEYRSGEYIYQGFLFDDHGAAGVPDPAGADSGYLNSFLFAVTAGTLTYPTGPGYDNNAADLLEFRVRPTATATDFRITLNTLENPALVGFTVAIGGQPGTEYAWPDEAGVKSPAQLFLTVHGTTATLTDAATGTALKPAPTVQVDLTRRQFEVSVPHTAWDPGANTVRLAAGVGLWDTTNDHYLVPAATASATAPGGGAPDHEALFDLAFRGSEPFPNWKLMGLSWTTGDAAVMEHATPCFWRECQQAEALAKGDVSPFYADVNFGMLRRHVTDTSGVPRSGDIDRIFASHFSYGQGVNFANPCGRFPTSCHGMFVGNLQPYGIYVPPGPVPKQGFGLVLLLHAATANYNEYMGSRNQTEFADRGQGAIVLTPMSRDPEGDYTDATEADVFEAWADLARHYRLDPSFTDISGYSMGGGGTYKLLERWPDLFARGVAAAAAPMDGGSQSQNMASLRDDPIMTWVSSADEGTPIVEQQPLITDLESYGLRFTFDQFLTGDHLTLATNDQYAPAAAFLGTGTVDLNPPRVTYIVDPASDYPADGTVANHAYWLSGLSLASASTALGTIDAKSYGFPVGEPAVNSPTTTPGLLTGGYHGPMPYVQTSETWADPAPATPTDRLDITTTNIGTVTIDLARARLDCHTTIHVTSDTPLKVSLPQCGTVLDLPAGTSVSEA